VEDDSAQNVRNTSSDGPIARTALDDVDRALLAALQADSRRSFAELAALCHVSRSTAHARVERMRRSGVITGYTIGLDPSALGYAVGALVFLKIRQHDWRRARDAIAAIAGVESLMMCAGEYDLVATVRCADMAAFRDTLLVQLHAIDDVLGSSTAFVLDETRRTLPPWPSAPPAPVIGRRADG
jgi:DNA-binding Lrp family transcriptional regulator